MSQQSCWGVLWFFKRPRVSPLDMQRKRQHDIRCLTTNAQENRDAIVSSVITRYLTLANIELLRLYLQFTCSVFTGICSVNMLFDFHKFLFCFYSAHFVRLFSVRLFVYSVYFLS
jgi:hypothetical protein